MTTRLTLQGRPRLKPGPKPDPKRLGELKYGEIDDTLTSAGGLPAMLELFSKDPLFLEFELRRLRVQGLSFAALAEWLDDKKVPTKNQVGKWNRRTVWEILRRGSDLSIQI